MVLSAIKIRDSRNLEDLKKEIAQAKRISLVVLMLVLPIFGMSRSTVIVDKLEVHPCPPLGAQLDS